MKTLRILSFVALSVAVAACSSNKDVASSGEIDDLYYQGSKTASTNSGVVVASTGDPEASYYDDKPYDSSTADAVDTTPESSEYDYYDEEYGRRIQNFHRSDDPDYAYSDGNNNNNSNVNYNIGVGYSAFGPYSGFGMGLSYGNMGWNPYGFGMGYGMNPYMGMGYGWGMPSWYFRSAWASPYYGFGFYDPWMNPYMSPYAWNSPFYNPYGWYGYNPYNPYYGGGWGWDAGTSTPIANTQRTSGTRGSARGGVVNSGRDSGRESANPSGISRTQADMETQRSGREGVVTDNNLRTREASSETSSPTRARQTRSDYFNESEADLSSRSRGNTPVASPDGDRSRAGFESQQRSYTQPRERSRETISPYTRQQSNRSGNVYTPPVQTNSPNRTYQRSPNFDRGTYNRTNPSRSSGGSYSPPSSPSRSGGGSYSPSPSRSSGGSSGGGSSRSRSR